MSWIGPAFEIYVGSWSVAMLIFSWSIERRLAELCAARTETDHESNRLSP